jgi:membrane protease YdiL (CAAX protease family)
MIEKTSVKEIIYILLAIGFIFFFPQFGFIPVPFGYAILITVATWFFLKTTGEDFSHLGFSFKRFELKAVIIGSLAGVLIFVLLQYLFFPLLRIIIQIEPARLDGFKQVRHHTGNYIFFVLMGFLGGGFYEELIFHGFIFTRLEKMIPGRHKILVAFLSTNIIFGLYHFQLGPSGVLNAFLAGCAYHAVMLKYNRNLWYSFFAHGIFDLIAFTYIYLGYW